MAVASIQSLVLEALALPQYGIEAGVAERAAPFDARMRDIALDQGELERQRLNWLPEAGQGLGLETFNVDLDEGGRAMPRDQSIDGSSTEPAMRLDQAWPSQPGASAAAAMKSADTVETVGLSRLTLELDDARLPSDRRRFDRDLRVAAVEQAQGSQQRRLRFDRDDPRAQPAERRQHDRPHGRRCRIRDRPAARNGGTAGPWPDRVAGCHNRCAATAQFLVRF